MSARTIAFACLLLAPSASAARGQVWQSPSLDQFSVRTSVLVPDRGGTVLGGVGRASGRASAAGVPGAGSLPGAGRLLGNRALDQAAQLGTASVHVTIIDHAALDRAVLAEAARRRGAASSEALRAEQLSGRMRGAAGGQAPGEGPLLSVAELRRRNEARHAAQAAEAAQLVAQGAAAETRGQISTARLFYQMARKRADPPLQRQITDRLNALTAAGQ